MTREESARKVFSEIRKELEKYDEDLSKKKEIIVFNKSDLLEEKDIKNKLKTFKNKTKKKFEIISVVDDNNLTNLRKILLKNVHK